MKNSFEKQIKNIKNMSNTPSKIRPKKVVAGMDFEVWRQRWPQVSPKGSPRHLPGSNLPEKASKMVANCHEKVVFFEVQLKAKSYGMPF